MSTKFDLSLYIPNLSIDCVVFGYEAGELKVLLSKPKYAPDFWALPGGYVAKTQGIDQAAASILKERTHLEDIFLEQFRVFGGEGRIVDNPFRNLARAGLRALDPVKFDEEVINWMTGRFISIGYFALVDISQVRPSVGELEEALAWFGLGSIPSLTYDHQEIIEEALQSLRQDLDRRLIGFALLPETFTMKELQVLYEAIFARQFPMNNFQKKMLDMGVLERLEKKFTGGSHKAPYLYRLKTR